MVLTHAIFTAGLPLQVFTLDTGRLHEETLALIQTIHERHGVAITRVQPDPATVKAHGDAHGAYAFYESVELRKACCSIRKRSEEHTSELQSLMRILYAVFCLKKKI